MSNRRDQYQGYRFVMRRQAGALLRVDPDDAGGTLRRLSDGVLASVVAAVLAAVGFAIFGALHPSTAAKGWLNGRTLIADETTGSRYLWLDGSLHPVLNYSSALLVVKSGAVGVTGVPHSAIAAEPQGAPVGIPGAPEAVPEAGKLLDSGWSACSSPATDATGAAAPQVSVAVGTAGAGAGAGAAIPADSGLLVAGPAGGEYLLWNGTRLRIPDTAGYVPVVLGAAATAPVPVGDAWLDAVPRGPDLAAPAVPDLGAPGPVVAGQPSVVGQVYEVAATASFYVLERGGLTPATPLRAQLLMAQRNQSAATALTAAEVPAPAVTGATGGTGAAAAGSDGSDGLPATVPKLLPVQTGQTAVCATVADPARGTVTVTTSTVAPVSTAHSAGRTTSGALRTPLADTVRVPVGHGALVRAVPGPGVTTGTLFLVTDAGVAYPVGDGGTVLNDLGLGQATPSPVPQSLLALIPVGPTLDEKAALATQPADPGPAAASGPASGTASAR